MFIIYLIIFVLAVLTPDLVTEGLPIFGEERTEEFVIFFWGVLIFLIFYWKDREALLNRKEKIDMQRRINQISKDLTLSYSFIGELNRKIEILKEVAAVMPKNSLIDKVKEDETFHSFVQSIRTLTGADNVCLKFMDLKTHKKLKEIVTKKDKKISNLQFPKEFSEKGSNMIEKNGYVFVKSANDIDDILAYAVIVKKKTQAVEDVELIMTLLNQALFFYSVLERIRQCHFDTQKES